MVGPVGIAEHFAGEQDQVGVPFGDRGLGLLRLGDHPADGGRNLGLAANSAGHGNQESGSPGDVRDVGRDEVVAHVEQIESGVFELPRQLDRFVDRHAAVDPVGAGGNDEHPGGGDDAMKPEAAPKGEEMKAAPEAGDEMKEMKEEK